MQFIKPFDCEQQGSASPQTVIFLIVATEGDILCPHKIYPELPHTLPCILAASPSEREGKRPYPRIMRCFLCSVISLLDIFYQYDSVCRRA